MCDAFGSCACNASSSASGDGIAATLACIGSLQGLAVTATGEVIFADAGSHRVRRLDAAGVITTLAGGNDGSRVPCSDPVVGGPATAACFSSPVGVSISATDGSVWVTDAASDPSSPGGQYVWRVNSTVTSPRTFAVAVAGNGTACAVPSDSNGDGGPATLACLYQPGGIVVAQGGNITFVDAWNNKVSIVIASAITNSNVYTRMHAHMHINTLIALKCEYFMFTSVRALPMQSRPTSSHASACSSLRYDGCTSTAAADTASRR